MYSIEVLHGSHVACQEQQILFPMGTNVLSNAKHFHCSCHATWLYTFKIQRHRKTAKGYIPYLLE